VIEIVHGDARQVEPPADIGCLVFDPPWDDAELLAWTPPPADNVLAFTDGRRFGQTVEKFGPPTWVFVWDTMNQWQSGPRRPLQQTKFCLWYGELDTYERDAQLWGEPPITRDNPTTKQTPLAGRRLIDLWRESIRWLHHPEPANGTAGPERFGKRQGDPVYRHAKPVGWLRCLVGNCSKGLIYDPFMGSGASLVAAKQLNRPAVGVDVDLACCEEVKRRIVGPLFAEVSA
jgi:hypothetical protein